MVLSTSTTRYLLPPGITSCPTILARIGQRTAYLTAIKSNPGMALLLT